MEPFRGLTLRRPWAQAIVDGPAATIGAKRVENRGHRPPAKFLGRRIALHAGARYDVDTWPMPGGFTPKAPEDCPRGVVGVATLVGYLDTRGGKRVSEHGLPILGDCAELHYLDEDPWWLGPVGWLLSDVVRLPEPVPCNGALGLWRLPPDVEFRLLQALATAPRG